jgi:DNA-binding response OmpR family regulator
MVVEDDAEMNDLERELLELHGFKAVPAYNGAQALEIFASTGPDAVLLDVMLPELDGFETCRRIRGLNHGRAGIVMVSALDSEDCRRRGYEVGADAYFTKPFDPDEIVLAIRRLIAVPRGHVASKS